MMNRYRTFVCVVLFAAPVSFAETIELTVSEPSGVVRNGWPVTSGVPLAAGELRRDTHVALFEATGAEIPLQTEVLSRWPDGSIRWLLLDFQIDIDVIEGTSFQRRVWRALLEIPYGQVRSYAWGAQRIGHPKAVRAVGQANGRNPVAIIVPCHRVIRSDGTIGGYGSGVGVKAALLRREGLNVPALENHSVTVQTRLRLYTKG